MNKLDYKYEILTPFKLCVIENFPFIEADFDAITNYQLMCKLAEYLNKISKNQNTMQTNMLEINNWFNNLDVQEEINNKLDEMAESGELTELIAQYLNLNGVLAFNTINELKNADNIVNGSVARTLGFNAISDGYGALYKIRTITSSDIVDNENIIALNISNTLIAEKIKENYDVKLDNINNNPVYYKKFILIGDSYGTNTNSNTTNWCEEFKNNLNISDNNIIINALGGARFDISQTAKTFSQLLNELDSDNSVTDIIVCGGYNDQGVPYNTIKNSIQNFKEIANTKFPNAKISIGFIGATTDYTKLYNLAYACKHYINSCKELNLNYLNNVQFTLKEYNTLMHGDKIHPNDDGAKRLGYNIAYSYLKGNITEYADYNGFGLVENDIFNIGSNPAWYYSRFNDVTYIGNRLQLSFTSKQDGGYNMGNGNSRVELASISDDSPIIGDSFETNAIPVNYLLQNNGTFYTGMGMLFIVNKKLLFRPLLCTSNNYLNLSNVTWIQIQPFKHALDSMFI